MALECFWAALWALLLLITVQGLQDDHPLPIPEIVKVSNIGVWQIRTEWMDNFNNHNNMENIIFDVEIFHTEQMRLVHNETIELKPHLTDPHTYHWIWTSPIPVRCTSHSVRLRYRDRSGTSDWTPLYTLKGNDSDEISQSYVYPIDHVARVGESTIFCCILKTQSIAGFSDPDFKIRISNRTYITEPVLHKKPSDSAGPNKACNGTGTTYFAGYAPDDQNLTCETRDLSSVECHWNPGRFTGEALPYVVHYFINGRSCSSPSQSMCVLNEDIKEGNTTWTLNAKNELGERNISFTAELKHRVRLRAPELGVLFTDFHARNATLTWKWKTEILNSFPMSCQVKLNKNIIKVKIDGIGPQSVLLADLQPFRNYTAHVRCGSQKNFYEWGDWGLISFTTEEDVPEAVDAWMQVLDNQTYVVWQHPTENQSHGIIQGYKLLVGSLSDMTRESISKDPKDSCHQLGPGSAERDHFISVSTRNSKYVSPSSNIIIPSLGSDSGIITTPISGNNSVFSVSWEPSPVSSCGYVVDWFPTYRAEKCGVKWTKTNLTYATTDSYLESGVKYTLSVYACTSGAPQLLQRRTGYVAELPPTGAVQNLKADVQASGVVLSWEEVPEEQRRGVIRGYKVSYSKSNTEGGHENSRINENTDFFLALETSKRVCTLSNLRPGDYMFKVKAFTSAGEGPGFKVSCNVGVQAYVMVVSILTVLGTAAFIITLIAICSTKREWLRSKLYPDIPKPQLSEGWWTKGSQLYLVIDKVLLSEKEMLMGKNSPAGLQVIPQKRQKDLEDVELVCSNPPQTVFSYNTRNSNTSSLVILDSSYIDVPSPCIQNPTYNLPLCDPAELDAGYRPQILQNVRNQVQTCDIAPVLMDSDYQPQSAVSMHTPGVPNHADLELNSSLISCPDYLLHNNCR